MISSTKVKESLVVNLFCVISDRKSPRVDQTALLLFLKQGTSFFKLNLQAKKFHFYLQYVQAKAWKWTFLNSLLQHGACFFCFFLLCIKLKLLQNCFKTNKPCANVTGN